MKILLKTCLLFLLSTFYLHGQEKSTPISNYILINEGGCANCTVKRPLSSLQELRVAIDKEFGDLISFKVKIPGQPTIIVNGNKSNASYINAIKLAKFGQVIKIFDLKTEKGKLNSYINIQLTR